MRQRRCPRCPYWLFEGLKFLASTLAFNSKKALKIKAFFISSYVFNSWTLVPRYSVASLLTTSPKSGNYAKIMHKCPIFFIFDMFMRSKTRFFCHLPPFLASILASTFQYSFPLMTKALRAFLSKSFFVIKLKLKLYQIHLIRHELIREMSVNSTHKAF